MSITVNEIVDAVMAECANDAIYVAKLHSVSNVVEGILAYATEHNITADPFVMLDTIFADKEVMRLVPFFNMAMDDFTRARDKRLAASKKSGAAVLDLLGIY